MIRVTCLEPSFHSVYTIVSCTCQATLRFSSTTVDNPYQAVHISSAVLKRLWSTTPSPSSSIPSTSVMAYPLPRFGAPPKTPMMDDGVPHEVKARTRDTIAVCKQYLAYAVLTIMLLLWARSWVSSSKKTDNVPFTHNPIEEYCYPPS